MYIRKKIAIISAWPIKSQISGVITSPIEGIHELETPAVIDAINTGGKHRSTCPRQHLPVTEDSRQGLKPSQRTIKLTIRIINIYRSHRTPSHRVLNGASVITATEDLLMCSMNAANANWYYYCMESTFPLSWNLPRNSRCRPTINSISFIHSGCWNIGRLCKRAQCIGYR